MTKLVFDGSRGKGWADPEIGGGWVDGDLLKTVAAGTFIPQGIVSAEAFGTASLQPQVSPTAIAGAEAFGACALQAQISPVGIVSAQAFGTHDIRVTISVNGVASGEAFGIPGVGQVVQAVGIASAEAFGTCVIGLQVSPVGIISGEAFGNAERVKYYDDADFRITINVHAIDVAIKNVPDLVASAQKLMAIAATAAEVMDLGIIMRMPDMGALVEVNDGFNVSRMKPTIEVANR